MYIYSNFNIGNIILIANSILVNDLSLKTETQSEEKKQFCKFHLASQNLMKLAIIES